MDYDTIPKEALEAEWKESFMMFNKNGNGQVNGKALGIVTESLGQPRTEAELRSMVREVDPANRGFIEYEQFAGVMDKEMRRSAIEQEYISELFRAFDRDNDGFLRKSDVADMLAQLGQTATDDELTYMIKEADIDADGMLSPIEFYDVVRQVL